ARHRARRVAAAGRAAEERAGDWALRRSGGGGARDGAAGRLMARARGLASIVRQPGRRTRRQGPGPTELVNPALTRHLLSIRAASYPGAAMSFSGKPDIKPTSPNDRP